MSQCSSDVGRRFIGATASHNVLHRQNCQVTLYLNYKTDRHEHENVINPLKGFLVGNKQTNPQDTIADLPYKHPFLKYCVIFDHSLQCQEILSVFHPQKEMMLTLSVQSSLCAWTID